MRPGLVPPSDDTLAGWYRLGTRPGRRRPRRPHRARRQRRRPAVFFRLRDVAVGDPVSVTRADGTTVRFTVTRVARFPKDAFPTAEVYAPTPGAELRLITCGGAFDRTARSYLDDVVVYAVARLSGGCPAPRQQAVCQCRRQSADDSVSHGSRSESRA